MKLLEDGERERANQTWIMTNWVEPWDTTMTRTSWQKFMERDMLTSLISKDWLRQHNLHQLILLHTKQHINRQEICSVCILPLQWQDIIITMHRPKSIFQPLFMEQQEFLLHLLVQEVLFFLPHLHTGRLQLLLLPICIIILHLQLQLDIIITIIMELSLIITPVISLLTLALIHIILDNCWLSNISQVLVSLIPTLFPFPSSVSKEYG